jgi:microcompartment protein CcmL/EutN
MVMLDAMEKTAGVRLIQTELNDGPGVCMKLGGLLADVEAAAASARAIGEQMQVQIVVDVIAQPAGPSRAAWESPPHVNPLLEQGAVEIPREDSSVNDSGFAVGLIETQGFTAVFEALDTALKAASVEVLAREKLGGGYITVVIRGDVAAVQTAIDVAKGRVEGLGRLIAAHVIPSPSPGVFAILPKL